MHAQTHFAGVGGLNAQAIRRAGMDQASGCHHQFAHRITGILMVAAAGLLQALEYLVQRFRADAVIDHALMATLLGGRAAAQYQAHAQFIGRLPYRIFQLGAGGVVVQVMVICAGSGP